MQINAFVPTEYVSLQGEAACAIAVPQVETHLPPLAPNQVHQAVAPVLLVISAENGTDNDPHFYVKVHDAGGESRGTVEQLFVWNDVPHLPLKWRVFDLKVTFLVFAAGVYTFGVYANPNDGPGQALTSFKVPIILDLQVQEVTYDGPNKP